MKEVVWTCHILCAHTYISVHFHAAVLHVSGSGGGGGRHAVSVPVARGRRSPALGPWVRGSPAQGRGRVLVGGSLGRGVRSCRLPSGPGSERLRMRRGCLLCTAGLFLQEVARSVSCPLRLLRALSAALFPVPALCCVRDSLFLVCQEEGIRKRQYVVPQHGDIVLSWWVTEFSCSGTLMELTFVVRVQ